MARRLIATLWFLAASVLAAQPASALQSPGAADPSVVIGLVATLTGPAALASQDMIDGFNLALKQLGGRFSNQEARLVVTDDKGSPDLARQQLHRLMERERLDVVMTSVGAPSLAAILPSLAESRLFVLNLDQMPPGLDGADCSPWLFNLAPPPDGVHEVLGQFLNSEKARRVVVVGPRNAMTDVAVAAFKRTFAGQVVAVLEPKPGAATFESELAEIAKIKPDAIYSLLGGGAGGAFVRAWGAWSLKAEVPLYPVGNAAERTYLPAMGEAAMDMGSIGTWGPEVDTAANRRFPGDFEAEYGRPASTWAAQGYDAANLLDAALKSTHGRTGDPETIRTALRKADFVSVRGPFKFATNHTPVLSYYLRRVGRDARGRPTQEIRAVVAKEWRDRQVAACPMRWFEEPMPAVIKRATP